MISPNDPLHPSPAPHFTTFKVFLIYGPKRPSFSTIQSYAPNVALQKLLKKEHIAVKKKVTNSDLFRKSYSGEKVGYTNG
jgi:hypothetical protein